MKNVREKVNHLITKTIKMFLGQCGYWGKYEKMIYGGSYYSGKRSILCF